MRDGGHSVVEGEEVVRLDARGHSRRLTRDWEHEILRLSRREGDPTHVDQAGVRTPIDSNGPRLLTEVLGSEKSVSGLSAGADHQRGQPYVLTGDAHTGVFDRERQALGKSRLQGI